MLKYIFSLLLVFCSLSSFAQVSIHQEDIEKIRITDKGGGLAGGFQFNYELLKRESSWQCYRKTFRSNFWGLSPEQKDWLRNAGAAPERLIKAIEAEKIESLLLAINTLKPELNRKQLGVTVAAMRNHADTAYTRMKRPKAWIEHVKEHYTDASIQTAMHDYQLSSWTDDRSTCLIEIITKNKDTVRISSEGQHSLMLPWKINGANTYDINISRFFAEAIDQNAVFSNYNRVAGTTFLAELNELIVRRHVKATPAYFEWTTENQENLTLLKSNFNLTDPIFDRGDAKCSLGYAAFPKGVTLEATIDIKNTKNIESLIRYRDSIVQYLKRNNFVFKAYLSKEGGRIEFPKYQYNHYDFYFLSDLVRERLPALKAYDLSKVLFFNARYKTGTSSWLLLPDNKLVLYDHVEPLAVDIPANILKLQDNPMFGMEDDAVFMLFDNRGKVLQVSKKLNPGDQ